jgi:hypothetical protein
LNIFTSQLTILTITVKQSKSNQGYLALISRGCCFKHSQMVISKRFFLGRGVFLFLIALSTFLFTEAAIPHDESVDLQKVSQ